MTGKSSYNNNWSYIDVETEQERFGLKPAYSYGPLTGYAPKGELDLPHVNHQQVQMDHFAQCVLKNKPSKVSGEEGLKDMKVIDAIYRSLDSGKWEKIG